MLIIDQWRSSSVKHPDGPVHKEKENDNFSLYIGDFKLAEDTNEKDIDELGERLVEYRSRDYNRRTISTFDALYEMNVIKGIKNVNDFKV